MSFNYRQGRQWSTPTAKRREGGQWVTIGGSGGGGGETDDPETNVYEARLNLEPTWSDTGRESLRDGTTTTITDSDSLDAAISNLNQGDTLVLEAGSYSAASLSNLPSHITIRGNDPNNKPVISSGTAGNGYRLSTSDSAGFTDSVSLVGTPTGYTDPNVANEGDPSEGDMSIEVSGSNLSNYSAGDYIYIRDLDLPFRQLTGLGGSPGVGGSTIEWNVVDSVDTTNNIINLQWPVSQWWYDNVSATVYRAPSWNAVDLRLYALHTQGTDGIELRGVRDGWVEDVTMEGGAVHLRCGDNLGQRMHNCSLIGGTDESVLNASNTHHFAATDTAVDGKSHRVFYCSGDAQDNGWNHYYSGITCTNIDNGYAFNCHWGSGQMYLEDVDMSATSNSGAGLFRLRSYSLHTGGENSVHKPSGQAAIQRGTQKMWRNDVRNCTVMDGDYGPLNFKYPHPDNDNDEHENLYYENIVVPSGVQLFEFQGDPPYEIDGLEIWNSYKASDVNNPQDSELYDVNEFLNESNGYDPTYHSNFLIQGEDPESHL